MRLIEHDTIVTIMRFIGALLLLLQLQPLGAAALCLHGHGSEVAECGDMHETQALAERTLAQPGTGHTAACMASDYCAWTAPAVLRFAQHFQVVASLHRAPAQLIAALAPGDPLTPPFHPPRA